MSARAKKNASPKGRQYTIRDVPGPVDTALRLRARATERSFNQVVIDALALGTGLRGTPVRDLSDIAGTCTDAEVKEMDALIAEQRTVDKKLWR
jgi:hypothetical protein